MFMSWESCLHTMLACVCLSLCNASQKAIKWTKFFKALRPMETFERPQEDFEASSLQPSPQPMPHPVSTAHNSIKLRDSHLDQSREADALASEIVSIHFLVLFE